MDDQVPLLSESSTPSLNSNSDDFFPPQSPPSFAQKYLSSLCDFKRKRDESTSNLNHTLGDNCEYNLHFDDLDNFQFPWEEYFGNSTADVDRVSCLPHNVSAEKVPKFSCTVPDSGNLVVVDNKMNSESTSSKCGKTSVGNENSDGDVNEEDSERKARLMRNRKSAQLSRRRKKQYVEELEEKVRNMDELEEKVRGMQFTITDINSKLSFAMAEIANLRQQLNGGNAMQPPPPAHMGAYLPRHMPAMPYPCIPYPCMPCVLPHTVNPECSQIRRVPSHRLKSQQVANAKKNGSSKGKKVASVTFLGLLFLVLFFGGGTGDGVSAGYFKNKFEDEHKWRVVTVNHGHLNGNHDMWSGFPSGKFDHIRKKKKRSQPSLSGLHEFLPPSNSSESESVFVGTLFEPRNDTLDGITHSVLANEKGMVPPSNASESESLFVAPLYEPRNDTLAGVTHSVLAKEKGMVPPSNASENESLSVPPLYEQRNDSLDGITHSVLANEKGMASQEQASNVDNKRDTGSGISKDFPPA